MQKIAIIGGGPSALFTLKQFVKQNHLDFEISIFEKARQLGAGMPYSQAGANDEHVTNVSGNEIPELHMSVQEWIAIAPKEILQHYNINQENFNEYKVLPRLLFGKYLEAQFAHYLLLARQKGVKVDVFLNEEVINADFDKSENQVYLDTEKRAGLAYDYAIICIGHHWPCDFEGKIKGYFDSPYPPSKLQLSVDFPVAIRGSSLTAIDAIRTLARHNGSFEQSDNGLITFKVSEKSKNFLMRLHSRSGLLPAVRFHLDDPHMFGHTYLSEDDIQKNMAINNGFLSLDFVFDKAFKAAIFEKDPTFYQSIYKLNIEEFVLKMMELRETLDPFTLLAAEYKEADKSIRRKETIYWKEMLGVLSFAMNQPAKHFSAEDMQRLQNHLSHLISIVIAFIPQASARELLALHRAGVLEIISVGDQASVKAGDEEGAVITYYENGKRYEEQYKLFIDCIGQKHLPIHEFPLKKLVDNKHVSQAYLKFSDAEQAKKLQNDSPSLLYKSGETDYYLRVSGITINDKFQLVDEFGAANPKLYMMAVPYISGYNPDYSGLDFCSAASEVIVNSLLNKLN